MRALLAGILVALLVVLAPASVVAHWAHRQVTDTDAYVHTVAPLAQDPAVQDVVVDRVTAELVTRLTDGTLGSTATEQRTLATLGISLGKRSLRAALTPYVHRQVSSFVRSDSFPRLWEGANRAAHGQLVALLTGREANGLRVEGDTVTLDLGVVVAAMKTRLVAQGIDAASRIPAVSVRLTLLRSDQLPALQRGVRILDRLNLWLPVLAALALLGALLLARRRLRVLAWAGLAVAATMLLLRLALVVLRHAYLDAVPAKQLPADAAGAIYDALVHGMVTTVSWVGGVALVVAVLAWLTETTRGRLSH